MYKNPLTYIVSNYYNCFKRWNLSHHYKENINLIFICNTAYNKKYAALQ